MQLHGSAGSKTNGELLRHVRLSGVAGFAAVIVLHGVDEALDAWHGRPIPPWEGLELALVVAIAWLTLVLMQRLMARITLLEGLVSICMRCKRVRTEHGWVAVERFVSARSDTEFSHGLCPACFERKYGGPGSRAR